MGADESQHIVGGSLLLVFLMNCLHEDSSYKHIVALGYLSFPSDCYAVHVSCCVCRVSRNEDILRPVSPSAQEQDGWM